MTSSTTTNADAPARKSVIPTLLTIFRMAMGPAIAALVLWAATQLYADRLLAGFIYALCADPVSARRARPIGSTAISRASSTR